jgi:hypothetical protein
MPPSKVNVQTTRRKFVKLATRVVALVETRPAVHDADAQSPLPGSVDLEFSLRYFRVANAPH